MNTLKEIITRSEAEFEKTSLVQLVRFYSSNRGSGHTFAAVNGVANTPNAFLLVRDEHQKLNTGLPKEKQVVMGSRDIILGGRRFAIVPDNYVVMEMATELKSHNRQATIALLEGVVEDVEEIFKRLQKQNNIASCQHKRELGLTDNEFDCSEMHIGYDEALADAKDDITTPLKALIKELKNTI